MKKLLSIILFLFFGSSIAFSQELSKNDSLALVAAVEAVFTNSEVLDSHEFQEISTNKIHCIIYSESYVLNRRSFYKKYFSSLNSLPEWQNSKNEKISFILQENDEVSVSFIPGELLDYNEAHDRPEITLYFRKVGGNFLLSGLDLTQ